MLQCLVNITLQQLTPYGGMERTKTFVLDFCHSFEVYSSWSSLSDTAVIEVPKNVYVKDPNGDTILWGDATTPDKVKGYVNAGGFGSKGVSTTPLIMRGDAITITAGYAYISQVNDDRSLNYHTKINTLFSGYVSSVESKSNLRIHCEDAMWLLKQVTMPTNTYSAQNNNNDISYVLNDIASKVNSVFKKSNFNSKGNTGGFELSVEGFTTGNETAAETLNSLKKILPSMGFYVRGNELRGGGIVYFPSDQNSTGTGGDGKPVYNTFNFQRNIVSDELHYSLQTDVKVAAICYSVNSAANKNNQSNKMGGMQYLTSRLQTTVGVADHDNPDAYEYYRFYFKDIAKEDILKTKGQTYLSRYQYDGYRGKFKTFGLPFIAHGNIITITDNLMPERNGNYMVKGVHYNYGVNSGLRQDIELHFRTDNIPRIFCSRLCS